MGVTAGPSYTTETGFTVSPLYLRINFFRLLNVTDSVIQASFGIQAYRSLPDQESNHAPIALPLYLSTAEIFITPTDLLRQSLYGIAYGALKLRWAAEGYTMTDVFEEGQPRPHQYVYDASGFNIDGFNSLGFKPDGYDAAGYDKNGYNKAGYDRNGYNILGFDGMGYNLAGYDSLGFDRFGFNSDGWDREGFGRDGYNAQGLDRLGNPRPIIIPHDLSGSTVQDLSGAVQDLSGSTVQDLSGSTVQDLSGNAGP